LGRWTQKDPIGSGNPYVYAGNVPNMQVDPSGKFTIHDLNCAALVITAVGTSVFAILGTASVLSWLATGATALLALATTVFLVALTVLVIAAASWLAFAYCNGLM